MAVAVVFGLAFATLLTLIVVPTLYTFFDDFALWVRRIAGRLGRLGRSTTQAAPAGE
jgi:HAE1 family hydrophobic/amphiphilic exporter-1